MCCMFVGTNVTFCKIAGLRNITVTARGGGVARVQFTSDSIGTTSEVVHTHFSGEALGGVYYRTLNLLSCAKFMVLLSRSPDEYAGIRNFSCSNLDALIMYDTTATKRMKPSDSN